MEEKQQPWLKTRLIIEIAGFPKEHIDNTLKKTAENFAKQGKNIKLTRSKIKDAQPVKLGKIEKTKLFSGFVELEADVADFSTLIGIIFDWMPSSVEILEPEQITDNIHELNGVLNDLAAKLHQYDSVVKKLKAKTILLSKELAKYKPPEEQKKENN